MKQEIAITSGLTKFSQMFGYLLDLLEEEGEKMGLCYGSPGVGKTTAAKYIANQENCFYMCAIGNLTPSSLTARVAECVGLTPQRSMIKNMDGIIDALGKSRKPLLIDEADFLTNKELLSVIRSIHDLANVPIILIGMTGIYPKIATQKLFVDRIQFFLEFPLCALEDTKLIAEAKCNVLIKDDLIKQIHKQTNGNTRRVRRVLAQIESLAYSNGLNEIDAAQWGDRAMIPANSQPPSKSRRSA
jgi:DNA transposition AAA+ family ATPase